MNLQNSNCISTLLGCMMEFLLVLIIVMTENLQPVRNSPFPCERFCKCPLMVSLGQKTLVGGKTARLGILDFFSRCMVIKIL